ncbi:hypothetical protein J6590_085235 [Homalodisca vitripennis]|nr:hypothetical protein J6590_085235 [Homalodisca vitripennis]
MSVYCTPFFSKSELGRAENIKTFEETAELFQEKFLKNFAQHRQNRNWTVVVGSFGIHSLNDTNHQITTRRAVTTDVTSRLSAVYTTHCTTVEITTRRAVTTHVTPSPRSSARCLLLVHYTLHHGRDND